MKPEAAYKTRLVKAVREDGGYARRLEDQFAVGLLDTMLAVRGARRVFLVEVKIARGTFFEPTPRQLEEMKRINDCSCEAVEALLIGFHPPTERHYYSTPCARAYLEHTPWAASRAHLIERLREL